MKKRMKSHFIRLKQSLRIHKNIIYIATGLLVFPVVIGLLYKIPIDFIDIEIGDLQVGIIDQGRNEWTVCFEQQHDFNIYCRTCIDLVG